MLLADVRAFMDERGENVIYSAELVDYLIELNERPWADWRHGKPITQNGVARLLRTFGIRSDDRRRGRSFGRATPGRNSKRHGPLICPTLRGTKKALQRYNPRPIRLSA